MPFPDRSRVVAWEQPVAMRTRRVRIGWATFEPAYARDSDRAVARVGETSHGREDLAPRVREKRELQLEGRDLESLIAALRSRIDVSVSQLLGGDLEAE